jgi:hypothetical protein
MLGSMEEWKLPEGSTPDPKDERVSPDGKFAPETWVKLDYLPNTLQELYHEVRQLLHESSKQVLGLLRWRYGKWVGYELHGKPGLFWYSASKDRWFRFPSYLPAVSGLELIGGMSFHDFVQAFISKRLNEREDEPIGHRILQNAYSLRNDARAAIVLAVSALEVGVKDLIARRAPDAEWLAFEVPAPAVEKIIREYLCKLHPHVEKAEYEAIFKKDILDGIRAAVTLRNSIAHRGLEATYDKATEVCDVVRDVLRRLDFISGETWIGKELTDERRLANSKRTIRLD